MLPEFATLVASCTCINQKLVNGWITDVWNLTQDNVALAVKCYQALLAGGLGTAEISAMERLLLDQGLPLRELLIDHENAKPNITRADVCELAAAASFVANDGWPSDTLHMPNVPKGSRAKSESGIDAMAITLDASAPDTELSAIELLHLGSVKHTIVASTYDVMSKLLRSVSLTELSVNYVCQQVRVLVGNLQAQGVQRPERAYMMLRDYPSKSARVNVSAAAVVDQDAYSDISARLEAMLPQVPDGAARLRVITMPELANLHERCV